MNARPFLHALDKAGERPPDHASAPSKKNYAERLSREVAQLVADALRDEFDGILPSADGKQQESAARTSKGLKKLDVNYSTPQLGLGLGVSIKTLNYRDRKSQRYTKNYTRVDSELRAEAVDYHERQPFAVLVGLFLIPLDACDDGQGTDASPSSFGAAVRTFRHRAGREGPRDDTQLFERFFVGLYGLEGSDRGDLLVFDVMEAPPRSGRPSSPPTTDFEGFIRATRDAYDDRNNPPFGWAGNKGGDT